MQEKARVLFDTAITFGEAALNNAVHFEINLLNDLVEVLTRFRVVGCACTIDLSKYFFQMAMPESHRDLFHLM